MLQDNLQVMVPKIVTDCSNIIVRDGARGRHQENGQEVISQRMRRECSQELAKNQSKEYNSSFQMNNPICEVEAMSRNMDKVRIKVSQKPKPVTIAQEMKARTAYETQSAGNAGRMISL